jgi:hypothetical protein
MNAIHPFLLWYLVISAGAMFIAFAWLSVADLIDKYIHGRPSDAMLGYNYSSGMTGMAVMTSAPFINLAFLVFLLRELYGTLRNKRSLRFRKE